LVISQGQQEQLAVGSWQLAKAEDRREDLFAHSVTCSVLVKGQGLIAKKASGICWITKELRPTNFHYGSARVPVAHANGRTVGNYIPDSRSGRINIL